MNPKVDTFLVDGCGRCEFYKTDKCKVRTWSKEIIALRRIILECGLEEEFKWSQPCYTYQKKNVVILSAYRNFASMAFFKGAMLNNSHGMLEKPGENSQASRQLKFTKLEDIEKNEARVKAIIFEAIELEKAGVKINYKKNPEPIPEELKKKFESSGALHEAFKNLTPGRQRGYILHFSQPKHSKTRISRIEKCIPKILRGEGFHDNYSSKIK